MSCVLMMGSRAATTSQSRFADDRRQAVVEGLRHRQDGMPRQYLLGVGGVDRDHHDGSLLVGGHVRRPAVQHEGCACRHVPTARAFQSAARVVLVLLLARTLGREDAVVRGDPGKETSKATSRIR